MLRPVGCKLTRLTKSLLLQGGCKTCCTTRCLATTSSSVISKSSLTLQPSTSDVELSYSVYPTDQSQVDSSKTSLLFLHGLFGAKGNLHSVSKHLSSSGRRVITYDARNHGNSGHVDEMDFPSMAQDLLDLVTELNIQQPSILGHSMGGKVAMTYALNNPDNLSKLIVADVSPQPSPGMEQLIEYAEAMKKINIPKELGIVKARKKAEVQLQPVVPDRGILSFLLTNLVEMEKGNVQWRLNLDAFLSNVEVIGSFPTTKFEPLRKPTLFVFGENSAHFQKADQGLIKSLFPQVQIEVIPNAGHFVHAEKPVEFVNIVQQFLDS